MNKLEDLIFQTDLASLPSEVLREVTIKRYGMDQGNSLDGLMDSLWSMSADNKEHLSHAVNYAFAGKVAVSWYFAAENDLKQAMEKLAKGNPNVFSKIMRYDEDTLVKGRVHVVGGVRLSPDFYVIRMLTMVGKRRVANGPSFVYRPQVHSGLAIISAKDEVLEIRANNKAKKYFEEFFANLLSIPNDQLNPKQLASFAESIDNLAIKLGGTVGPVSSKPGEDIELIAEDEQDVIIEILEAVSAYIASGDLEVVARELSEGRGALAESILINTPLASVFAGSLQRIGLKPKKEEDTRNSLIYRWLRSYLEHQNADVVFSVIEGDGSTAVHTVGIGVESNSIFFRTKASERAIRKIRPVILDAEDMVSEWDILLGGEIEDEQTA